MLSMGRRGHRSCLVGDIVEYLLSELVALGASFGGSRSANNEEVKGYLDSRGRNKSGEVVDDGVDQIEHGES